MPRAFNPTLPDSAVGSAAGSAVDLLHALVVAVVRPARLQDDRRDDEVEDPVLDEAAAGHERPRRTRAGAPTYHNHCGSRGSATM